MTYAAIALIVVFILVIGILVPKDTKPSTEKKKNNSIWWGVFVAFLIALGAYLRSIGFFPN